MTHQSVVHTFSVNQAIEFLLEVGCSGAMLVFDGHTRQEDVPSIVATLKSTKSAPATEVVRSIESILAMNDTELRDRHSYFHKFMATEGLAVLKGVMQVDVRASEVGALADYSEPLPIPSKASYMKEFLLEYGVDYVPVLFTSSFDGSKELFNLIQMLRADAVNNPKAKEILVRCEDLWGEVQAENEAELANSFRKKLMEASERDIRRTEVRPLGQSAEIEKTLQFH